MLVAVAELEKYMDIRFSPRQIAAAEMVLEGLQGELEAHLNRPIERGEHVETHVIASDPTVWPASSFFYEPSLDRTGWGIPSFSSPTTVYFNSTPAASVTSVEVVSGNNDPVVLGQNIDFTATGHGIEMPYARPGDVVTITYVGGLSGHAEKFFRLLILRAAAREMTNMHDDVVGVKDLNVSGARERETGFTDQELRSALRYKRWRP